MYSNERLWATLLYSMFPYTEYKSATHVSNTSGACSRSGCPGGCGVERRFYQGWNLSVKTGGTVWTFPQADEIKREKSERKKSSYGLQYWNTCKEEKAVVRFVQFNWVAKALFSLQASSAKAERLFINLGRIEERVRQSFFDSSSETTKTCTPMSMSS